MQDIIKKIKNSHPSYLSYDEAKTRQVIVLPILQKLGWDIFDGDEVFPEYGISGKRVDYSLRSNDKNEFFVEVKKCSVDLDLHHEQLLGYAFREGVSLACLTNGITWQFFLPLIEGSWESRLFYTINIEEQEIEELILVFDKILGKNAVITKEAIKNAKDLQESSIREKVLRKSIPEAWEQLLKNPTEVFLDAICDKVEKNSGYRPSPEQISNFLLKRIPSNGPSSAQRIVPSNTVVKPREAYRKVIDEPANTNRPFVMIKGVKIYTERLGSNSEKYFSEIIPQLISVLPESEINNLQDTYHCNRYNLTGRQYPVLSEKDTEMQGNDGRFRAYKHQIAGFWVTKEWSEDRLRSWKKYLEELAMKLPD